MPRPEIEKEIEIDAAVRQAIRRDARPPRFDRVILAGRSELDALMAHYRRPVRIEIHGGTSVTICAPQE